MCEPSLGPVKTAEAKQSVHLLSHLDALSAWHARRHLHRNNRLRRELEETRKKHVKLQEDHEQLKERLSATEKERQDCKELVQMIIGRMMGQGASLPTTAVLEEEAPLQLPLDVIGVISEFLAGDHAFGTLSNLNLANHAVRDGTLPVLYETVLFDNVKNLPYYGGGGKIKKLMAFKYTRFYLCSHTPDLVLFDLTRLFPKLVMTIMKSINLMPASTQTRRKRSARSSGRLSTIRRFLTTTVLMRKGYRQPLLRAPETVRFFWLAEGAKLADTDTLGQEPNWTTPIRLEDASFVEPLMMNKEKAAHVNTVIELLKLADRHEDKRYLRALDRKLSLGEVWPTMKPKCQNAVRYQQWHISLNLGLWEFSKLVQKLWRPFATRPEMLRYRPQILLCRWLSKDHFTAMVEGFAEFYMGALSSTRFLPGVGPFHLLFAIATVYGHPDEHKTKAARYVGVTRFARERGGSECRFAEKIITEVEGTVVDSAFGRVETMARDPRKTL